MSEEEEARNIAGHIETYRSELWDIIMRDGANRDPKLRLSRAIAVCVAALEMWYFLVGEHAETDSVFAALKEAKVAMEKASDDVYEEAMVRWLAMQEGEMKEEVRG